MFTHSLLKLTETPLNALTAICCRASFWRVFVLCSKSTVEKTLYITILSLLKSVQPHTNSAAKRKKTFNWTEFNQIFNYTEWALKSCIPNDSNNCEWTWEWRRREKKWEGGDDIIVLSAGLHFFLLRIKFNGRKYHSDETAQ